MTDVSKLCTRFRCIAGVLAALVFAASGLKGDPAQRIAPVAPVPDRAQWEISFSSDGGALANAAEKARPKVASMTFVKTPTAGKIETQYADGSRAQAFATSHYFLAETPGGKDITVERIGDLSNPEARFLDEFPFVAWVEEKYLVGEAELEGRKCLHYRTEATVAAPSENSAGQPQLHEAWIDAATLLPAAFRIDGLLGRYVFQAAPTKPVVMPEIFQARIKQYFAAPPPPPTR